MYKLKEYIKVEINNNKSDKFLDTIKNVIKSPSKRAIFYIRISQKLKERRLNTLAYLLKNKLSYTYGIFFTFNTKIGIGLKLPHANGIIIGDGVVIGENVTIYHQVTLGGKNIGDSVTNSYPKIENDVIIYAGAKVLGSVTIKQGTIIGANSVVTKDTDKYGVYGGIPVIKIK